MDEGKFDLYDKEKENPCDGCTICCEYVALELDEPESKEDFDEIKWFLLHKDVWVYIDNDDTWNIQFNSKCQKLDERGWCGIYEERPEICRNHESDGCEKHGEGSAYKEIWKSYEEFIEWLRENRAEMV